MLYTCDKCGKYRPDMVIDTEKDMIICPDCGYSKPFLRMPLFAVGGASGTGKTAICKTLAGKLDRFVILDGDVLWDDERYTRDNTAEFYEYALRIAMNISQSGLKVAIFHAGFGVPGNLENCVAKRYFSAIHYLGLYCSDEELEKRLYARPSTQGEAGKSFVNAMKGFNSFFRFYHGEPTMDKLDTTGCSLEETAAQVAEWLKSK